MEPRNIMVDPRVYRGSVAASQRAREECTRRQINSQLNEQRFRADVIRNRLKMGLARNIADAAVAHATRRSRISRLACISGYEHPHRYHQLTDGSSKSTLYPKIPTQLAPLLPTDPRIKFTKPRNAHGNVQLIPLSATAPSKQSPYYKSAPEALYRPSGVRQPMLTPPPTSAGVIGRNHVLVQTVDSFDEHVAPIVDELVTLSIEAARASLAQEERKRQETLRTNQLINQLSHQRAITQQLMHTIGENQHHHEEIIREKEETIREYEKRESAQIAVKMVDELIDGSVSNVVDSGLVEETATVRHIATDTQHLNKTFLKQKLVLAELENDFVPWLLKRVDNTVEHYIASSCLHDAYFCTDDRIRNLSKSKVNEKLRYSKR